MTSLLTSAATEIQSPSLVSGPPAVAAAGPATVRSRFDCGSHKTIWWVARENGWTCCQHRHTTPDAAVGCWNSHFLSATRS